MQEAKVQYEQKMINGVKVDELYRTIDAVKDTPDIAKFKFRARNKWINGGHNHTKIKDFYGVQKDHVHEKPFDLDADEPPVLLGQDKGPNPVEYALTALAAGSAIGLLIVLLTKSVFILTLGIIGLLGGFFYTAPPIKLGYRYIGEFIIALLFGLFPVYASYYLQTETIDFNPLLPALIVSILIFLVILINEFPDVSADAAVNKKTLIVHFGVPTSVWIYRAALIGSFIIAAVMLIYRSMFFAGLIYLSTLPIAAFAIKSANEKDLAKPGQYRASQITVLLHAIGSLALTIGFTITGLRNIAV